MAFRPISGIGFAFAYDGKHSRPGARGLARRPPFHLAARAARSANGYFVTPGTGHRSSSGQRYERARSVAHVHVIASIPEIGYSLPRHAGAIGPAPPPNSQRRVPETGVPIPPVASWVRAVRNA